jgi:hypothetical protein
MLFSICTTESQKATHSRTEMLHKSDTVFQLQVCAGWLLAAVGFLGVLYGMLPFQQPDYVYDALESSMYNCLHRAIWSFAIGWIIFACVKGYGGIRAMH